MLKSSANENNEKVSSNVIEEKENQDEARNRKNNRLGYSQKVNEFVYLRLHG